MKTQLQKKTLSSLSTGFSGLDVVTLGLKPGLLNVIAGRPGSGKTTFALTVARNVAGAARQVIFFSLEMPGPDLSHRLISAESGIDGHRLFRGILYSDEWSLSIEAANALTKLPLVIDDTGELPIDRLMERARRIKAEKGLALVVADYLQLIRPSRIWETREEEIAEVSRSLKALAKELNVPVLVTSQMYRSAEEEGNSYPSFSDLHESLVIERDADIVIFLWPMDDGSNTMRLIIAKHRQGPTGEIELLFDRKRTRFENP